MLLQIALFHSFQGLSDIPLYICNTSSVSTHLAIDIDCFHVLAMNSATMSIGVHIYPLDYGTVLANKCHSLTGFLYLQILFHIFNSDTIISPDTCPQVGLQDHIVILLQEIGMYEGMATHSSILAWRIPLDRGGWWAVVLQVTKSQA